MNRKKEMEAVCKELASYGYDVEVREIHKNNETKLGLLIGDAEVKMIIYEDQIDWKNNPIIDIAILFDEYKEKRPMINNEWSSKEYIMENSEVWLCKREWNEERLKNILHRQVGESDLEAYIKVKVDTNKKFALTKAMADNLGIGTEIFKTALANEEYTLRNINAVVAESSGIDIIELPPMPISVLTSKSGVGGAAGILTHLIDYFMEDSGADEVYIIPSSVHELLVIDKELSSPEQLKSMIGEVNDTCFDGNEEILSNHPYIYNKKTLRNA